MNHFEDITFLTAEQLAKRLQVSRATIFNWMQKGILAQETHFFKQGRVLRFIWSNDLVLELMKGTGVDAKERPAVKPDSMPIHNKKSSPINWEY